MNEQRLTSLFDGFLAAILLAAIVVGTVYAITGDHHRPPATTTTTTTVAPSPTTTTSTVPHVAGRRGGYCVTTDPANAAADGITPDPSCPGGTP